MKIQKINGKEVEFENVADVFDKTRKERNEYFGKYVAEVSDNNPLNLDAIANKIKELKEEYNLYLTNLDILADAVKGEKKEADAKKLTEQVNNMSNEQLVALKAAIKAKENQQQN